MTDITLNCTGKANSPGLTLDLPSNNPFRNRAASPSSLDSLPSPQSLNFNLQTPPERPRSRNPFLDGEQLDIFAPNPRPASPQRMSGSTSPVRGGLYGNTAELFVSPCTNTSMKHTNGGDTPRITLPLTRKRPVMARINHLHTKSAPHEQRTSHRLRRSSVLPCTSKTNPKKTHGSGKGTQRSLGMGNKQRMYSQIPPLTDFAQGVIPTRRWQIGTGKS